MLGSQETCTWASVGPYRDTCSQGKWGGVALSLTLPFSGPCLWLLAGTWSPVLSVPVTRSLSPELQPGGPGTRTGLEWMPLTLSTDVTASPRPRSTPEPRGNSWALTMQTDDKYPETEPQEPGQCHPRGLRPEEGQTHRGCRRRRKRPVEPSALGTAHFPAAQKGWKCPPGVTRTC